MGPKGFGRLEPTGGVVKVPQIVVHEGDEPDALGGLHAHLLSRKDLTEIDLAPLRADAAAPGHDGGPVVKRIVQLLVRG